MNSLGKKQLIPTFTKYLNEYKQLEFEYSRIPSWRWVKLFRNLKARESLTRVYTAKMRTWDL